MELHNVKPNKLLGDRGYDSDDIRNRLNARAVVPIIPPRSKRKKPRL
jgi:IS5 family transposase